VRNVLLLCATFKKQKYQKILKTFFAQIIFNMFWFHYIWTCFLIRASALDHHLLQCDASYFGGYVPGSEEPFFPNHGITTQKLWSLFSPLWKLVVSVHLFSFFPPSSYVPTNFFYGANGARLPLPHVPSWWAQGQPLPLYSPTWCDPLLWCVRGKEKCWDSKYLLSAYSLKQNALLSIESFIAQYMIGVK
jgi:hypothetical protein